MVIIVDMGTWWIESFRIEGANPLAAGAVENINFDLSRAGTYLGSSTGIFQTSMSDTEILTAVLAKRDANGIDIGVHLATDACRIQILAGAAGAISFPRVNLLMFMRQSKTI